MKKNNILMIVIFTIITAIYNIVLFAVVYNHTQVFWSAYIFTMVSFISNCGIYYISLRNEVKARDKFLNLPMPILSTFYLIIQFVLGIILMAIPNMSIVIANVLQIVLLGAFAIISILSIVGTNVTKDFDNAVNKKVFYIKSLASDVEGLKNSCVDAETKKLLEQLYDTIKYSDPISHSALEHIENQISQKIYNLKEVVNNKNLAMQLCNEVTCLVIERNSKCKILK